MTDSAAEYISRSPAGAEYVKLITSVEADRRARDAFHELALRIAPRGGSLFDFGAGPGIDARYFAEQGFKVEAYDVDPRMREFFKEYCRSCIEAGRITLDSSDYKQFVTRAAPLTGRRVDLLVSNFAPLNQVDDLRELFGKFHALTKPDGKVLASVLNPCYLGDLKLRWWWRSAARLWRAGQFFMPGPQAPHFRRLPSNFDSTASPHFRLARIYRGMPSAGADAAQGVDFTRGANVGWLPLSTSRFIFLLFDRLD